MKLSQGFTLLELMIAIAIITFLSVLTLPSLMKTLARSKRTEAYLYLRTLAQAQKVYYAEHGKYSSDLAGPGGIGWAPEGNHIYTYGFAGTPEGVGHFIGSSETPSSALTGSKVSRSEFVIAAAGKIYGDTLDVLTIDQTGTLKIVSDGLQS